MSIQEIYNKAAFLKTDAKTTPTERELCGLVCELTVQLKNVSDALAKAQGVPNPPSKLFTDKK